MCSPDDDEDEEEEEDSSCMVSSALSDTFCFLFDADSGSTTVAGGTVSVVGVESTVVVATVSVEVGVATGISRGRRVPALAFAGEADRALIYVGWI
jgi:hypothetical protein